MVEGKLLTGFRKLEDRRAEDAEKAVDGENSEPDKADDLESAKKSPRKTP